MTYSIVARDSASGELGVALQSRWPASGAAVAWARAGVGAIATQAFTDVRYGAVGLDLLAAGSSPSEALAALLEADPDPGVRQVAMVDAAGRTATHTGADCIRAAGHLRGDGVSVQANTVERATAWPAMLAAYSSTEGDLADRLLAALVAAEGEGGDVRGRRSAALVVVPGGSAEPTWARRFDLRVDDAPDPLGELARLLAVARGYEALDLALEALAAGERAAALAFFEAAAAFAPEDDQLRLWLALAVFDDGDEARAWRLYRAALAFEPRSAEHLRRFAEAGQLPGRERLVELLTTEARR